MKVEIDLETIHCLSNGDCIEISGEVGEKKMEVVFFIAKDPKFKCSLDHKYGWDVYIMSKNDNDIQSGTIFTSLEYHPKATFILIFRILSASISTILNEKELNVTNRIISVNDITSITISGGNIIKHVSFSDYSKKTARVLQPIIYKSLKSSEKGDEGVITLMESRQRIVFNLRKNEKATLPSSEFDSDSDSDLESYDKLNVLRDFNYLKTILLSKTNTDDNEFLSHYKSDFPANKYIISYYDPDETDCVNYKSPNFNYSDFPLKYDFEDTANENLLENASKINLLDFQAESNNKSIENTNAEIEETKLSTSSSKDFDNERKNKNKSPIPVLTIKESDHKSNISRNNSSCSKIPILKKPNSNEKEKVVENVNNSKVLLMNQKTTIKTSSKKKTLSSHQNPQKNVNKN